MGPRIGVVVPVYKTELYVAECIESILAQTYTEFRLILVDDGSPDNAGEICDEYAKKDNRITVIHQENAGVTRARARGVEEANDCEWITFVDSDDILPLDALGTLYSMIYENINISIGVMARFSNNEHTNNRESNHKISTIGVEELRKRAITGVDCSLCAKLVKKELLNKYTFNIPRDIIVGEDSIANVRITFKNKHKAVVTTKPVYYYRQHADSRMHTFNHNVEYEEKYTDFIWESIPCDEKRKYINSYIEARISCFDSLFGYSTNTPEWINTNFHKKLINDIKTYQFYNLPIERMLLIVQNKRIRAILIFAKRVKNWITRHLSLK